MCGYVKCLNCDLCDGDDGDDGNGRGSSDGFLSRRDADSVQDVEPEYRFCGVWRRVGYNHA